MKEKNRTIIGEGSYTIKREKKNERVILTIESEKRLKGSHYAIICVAVCIIMGIIIGWPIFSTFLAQFF